MTLGSATTVLFASKIGIPVSTTQCMVGAIVSVGESYKTLHRRQYALLGVARSRSVHAVNWRLFGRMALAWLLITPISGLLCALFVVILRTMIY